MPETSTVKTLVELAPLANYFLVPMFPTLLLGISALFKWIRKTDSRLSAIETACDIRHERRRRQ